MASQSLISFDDVTGLILRGPKGSVDRLDIPARVTPDSYQERLLPGTHHYACSETEGVSFAAMR
nr:MAG: hypothetical protein H2Bulk36235_000002 [Mitovirus sp.]